MERSAFNRILLAFFTAICFSDLAAQSPAPKDFHGFVQVQDPHELFEYGRLPLRFETNRGQTDQRVKFLSYGAGYTLSLTPTELILALRNKREARSEAIGIRLLGADPEAKLIGINELPGKVSYFVGNDRSRWITDVPTYVRVRYQQIYPGIDLLFYGNGQQLESDFVVEPGRDPGQIRLQIEGRKELNLSREGDLVLKTSEGEMRLLKPHVYQEIGGTRHSVAGRYVGRGTRTLSFSLGPYDHTAPLIIDPVLVYSTALNGAHFTVGNGGGHGIAVDAAGNAYVTGYTDFSNFLPTAGAFTTTSGSLFVTKLSPTGSALDYTAVFGGSSSDVAMAVAVDPQGEAVVVGSTSSPNFPTQNALQSTLPAGTHAFVLKLTASGAALSYATLLGGSGAKGSGNGTDIANGVTIDASGAIYVTGSTNSTDFPTKNAVQPACPDLQMNGYCNVQGFAAKLDPTQSGAASLVYSTFLGGNFPTYGQGVAVDGSGNAYITGSTNATDFPTTLGVFQTTLVGGSDAFVSVLNPGGNAFVYSTYLGYGFGWAIAVDAEGNAHVTGATNTFGGAFPTTPGAFQTTLAGSATSDHAFIAKVNPSGTALIYSTLFGGSGMENSNTGDIAVDAQGDAYISGVTSSIDFPTTNAVQTTYGGGNSDAFVAELNPAGSGLVYSTYLGGSGDDAAYGIAIDASGAAYVMGSTGSANFPTTSGAFETGVNTGAGSLFVSKIGTPSTTTTQATHFAVSSPASATAGTAFSFSVTALDQSNNTVKNYVGTVGFTSTDNSAGLPLPYTFSAFDAGSHMFNTTLNTGGNQAITATDATNNAITGTSNPITVNSTAPPPPPPVQIVDNETISTTDSVSFPDVFDAEEIRANDAVTVTPLIKVTAPAAFFSPGTLGFANVAAGQSATQSLTISDIGQAPLTVASAAVSQVSAFTISQIACSNGASSLPTTLPLGGACTFLISYSAPSSGTAASDTLTFTDNAALANMASILAGSNYTQSIALNGSGTSTPPPPPPSAIIPVVDNETITTTDAVSFADVFDSENITVSDQVSTRILNMTTTSISLSGGGVYGSPATAIVSVGSSTAVVTGSVSLTVDGGTATTLLLTNSSAALNLGVLTPGSHVLAANFAEQGGFISSSAATTLIVNQASTTTRLSVSPNPSNFGQSVTLSSTVAPVAPGAGTATGKVTFFDGTAALGTVTLTPVDTAAFTITTLAAGNHSLNASYNGDSNFIASSSTAVSDQVVCGVLVSFSSSSVRLGGTTTVTGKVISCATTTQTVVIKFTLSGPAQPNSCSSTSSVMFTTPAFALPAKTSQTVSFPFKVPSGVCPGTYTITAATLVNGAAVNTSTTSLTITAH